MSSVASENGTNTRKNDNELSDTMSNVFYIAHKALKRTTTNSLQVIVLVIIQQTQFLNILFDSWYDYPWNFPLISNIIYIITKVSLIWPFFAEMGSYIYLSIFLILGILFAAIIFLIIAIILRSNKNSKLFDPISYFISYSTIYLHTIVFMPLITLFSSIFMCQSSGSSTENRYLHISCKDSSYFIYMSCGIFFLIVIIIFTLILTYIVFEKGFQETNLMAKNSSQTDILELISEIIATLVGSYLKTSSTIVIVIIKFISSFILVYAFRKERRFYDPLISEIWNGFVAIRMWISACLIFSLLTSSYNFSGGFILLILGLPIVIGICFGFSNDKLDILSIHILDNLSYDEFILFIKTVSNLFSHKPTQVQERISIGALKALHNELCPLLGECSIEEFKEGTNKVLLPSKTVETYQSENLLSEHIEKVLDYVVQKHKHNPNYLLAYSQYLLFYGREPALAIKYITLTRQLKVDTDSRLWMYRLEVMLDDRTKCKITGESKQKINVINFMMYEKYQHTFSGLLEQSGLLHMQFWTTLLDESPSMIKSYEIGAKILQVYEQIEDTWKQIQSIIENNPIDLKAYSKYLIEIFNDREMGTQIALRISSSLFASKMSSIFTTHLTDISNFSSDGAACVYISGNKSNIGDITNCNMAFCRVFGYGKKELIGLNIRYLIPDLIGEHHTFFLKRNMERNKISVFNLEGREINSLARGKHKYLFPVNIKLLNTPNLLNDMQYISKVVIEKKIASTNMCVLLLDMKGHVVGMTSNCILQLNLSNNVLDRYYVDMNIIAPELFFSKVYYSKNGYPLKLFIPSEPPVALKNMNMIQADSEEKQYLQKGEHSIELHGWLSDLKYEEIGQIGYVVKLEKRKEEIQALALRKFIKIPQFQFKFDEYYGKIVREIREEEGNNMLNTNSSSFNYAQIAVARKRSIIYDHKTNTSSGIDLSQLSSSQFRRMSSTINIPSRSVSRTTTKTIGKSEFDKSASPELVRKNSFISIISDVQTSSNKHGKYYDNLLSKYNVLGKYMNDAGAIGLLDKIARQIMYGEQIKTFRFQEGTYVEVTQDDGAKLLEKEIEQQEIGDETGGRRNLVDKDEQEYMVLRARIKTKKDILKIIEKAKYPWQIRIQKVQAFCGILILTALLLIEYILNNNMMADISSAATLIHNSFSLAHSLLLMANFARETYFLHKEEQNYTSYGTDFTTKENYQTFLKSFTETLLQTSEEYIYSLQDYGFSSSVIQGAMNGSSFMKSFFFVSSTSGNFYEYDLPSSLSTSYINALNSITQIYHNYDPEFLDDSIQFVLSSIYIIHGYVFNYLNINANEFSNFLVGKSNGTNITDILILTFSGCVCILSILSFKWLNNAIEEYNYKILYILLDIPRKFVLFLNTQAESFVAEFENNEKNQEVESIEGSIGEATDPEENVYKRFKKSGFVRFYTYRMSLGIKYLISYLFILFCALAYFIYLFFDRRNFYINLGAFSTQLVAAHEERNSYLYILHSYNEYLYNSSAFLGSNESLQSLAPSLWGRAYDKTANLSNENIVSASFLSSEDKNWIDMISNSNLCSLLNNTSTLSKARCSSICDGCITQGLDLVRSSLIDFFKEIVQNPNELLSNKINDSKLWDIKQVHNEVYIVFTKLTIDKLNLAMNSNYQFEKTTKVYFLVCLLVVLVVVFLILCYPFLKEIFNTVRNSRKMLHILPIECIIRCKYFKKLILKKSKF